MSESDLDFESASENTRLMDAHVATTSTVGAGDVGNAPTRRKKARSTNNQSNNHVNYGAVSWGTTRRGSSVAVTVFFRRLRSFPKLLYVQHSRIFRWITITR